MKIEIKSLEELKNYPELAKLLIDSYKYNEDINDDENITLGDVYWDDMILAVTERSLCEDDEDDDYVVNTYSVEMGEYIFEVFSQQYKDDGMLCDEEFSPIYATKLSDVSPKIELTKEQIKNRQKWQQLKQNLTKNQFMDFLTNHVPFPDQLTMFQN